jgi:peptide/nickel transport system substrate-binding protein
MKRSLAVAVILSLLLQTVAGMTVAHAQGKTVIVGMGQEPDRLFNSNMLVASLVKNAIFDHMINVDNRMRPYPQLALDVPTLENGGAQFVGEGMDRALQVTFNLRQGVTWSDGTPFTSEDVKATWELVMNPLSGMDNAIEAKIDRIDTPDPSTVVITFLSANAARRADPAAYAGQEGPVIDPLYFMVPNYYEQVLYPAHILRPMADDNLRTSPKVDDITRSDFARNPVGTGPFVVESWDPGTQIVLRARADSWRAPKLDTVVFRIIPSKDTAIAALQAGEVDLVTQDSLDVGDAAVLDSIVGVTPQYVPGTVWEHLTLNLDNPILNDKDVRQAMAYGLDREELNQVILFGKSEVAHSQIPSWHAFYNPDVFKYDFNLNRANALLELAGWTPGPDGIRTKAGQRLSVKYWSTGSAFRPRMLPLVKDQLSRIGMEMNIEFVPASVYFDTKASSPQSLSARQFDVGEFAWVGGFDSGQDLKYSNHSVNIPSRENGYKGGNYAGFRNTRNDLLLDQGLAVLDQGLRAGIYREVQYVQQEELPVIPLVLRPITIAAKNSLVNLKGSMSSSGETWNIHEWETVP